MNLKTKGYFFFSEYKDEIIELIRKIVEESKDRIDLSEIYDQTCKTLGIRSINSEDTQTLWTYLVRVVIETKLLELEKSP